MSSLTQQWNRMGAKVGAALEDRYAFFAPSWAYDSDIAAARAAASRREAAQVLWSTMRDASRASREAAARSIRRAGRALSTAPSTTRRAA